MDNKEQFIEYCKEIKREGIDELLKWLNGTDFFEAPASHRYHGSYVGGLLEHSLHVYDELKKIIGLYPEIKVSDESVIICALMHDFCKIGMYSQEIKNRKNPATGRWEERMEYVVDEKYCFGGHGSKSVFLIQHFLQLTPEEATAINCHMGAFENEHVGKAYEQFPFAWALHVADEAATYLIEK